MKQPDPNTLKVVTRTLKGGDGYEWTTHRVEGRDENGQRIRKCFKDRRQADAFITAMRTKLLNAQTAVTTAVTRLTPDQLKQAESAFARLGSRYTLDEVVGYFVANYAAPDESVTLDKAIEAFGKQKDVRKNSLRSINSTITRFRDYLGGGSVEVHAITEKQVRGFLASVRAKDGVSPASKKTFNNYRNDISSLLTWCMDKQRRWVAKNVAREVAMYKREELRHAAAPETLTPSEALTLMQAAAKHEPSLAKAYALMLFAGIRPDDNGELFKLARHPEVDQLINLGTRTIRILPEIAKTKRFRKVRISDNVLAWLKQSGPILPTNASRHFKSFRPAQGLSADVCRHTFCTNHVATHGSLAATALQSGNSEQIIRDHYADQITAADAAPFWRIMPDEKAGAVIAPTTRPAKKAASSKPKK